MQEMALSAQNGHFILQSHIKTIPHGVQWKSMSSYMVKLMNEGQMCASTTVMTAKSNNQSILWLLELGY